MVRWRIVNLMQWLWEEFRLLVSKQTMSKEPRAPGFRELSARPRHHAKDKAAEAALKMYGPPPVRKRFRFDGVKRSASMMGWTAPLSRAGG